MRIGARRRSHGLSQRQAAAEIGVSASTLSRLENGSHLPHREPLLRIAQWLNVPLEWAAEGAARAGSGVQHSEMSTVEAVELHLRADRSVSTADADALIESFRLLYERLRARDT
jgi:transcriptional regulator with XRE-family HTH domain